MVKASSLKLSAESSSAYHHGDYAAAENLAAAALKEDSHNTDALLILGNVFYLRQDYSPALNYYQKLLNLSPQNNRVKINLSNTFYAMKNYAPAKAYAREVLAVEPDNFSARAALAYALFAEENYADSLNEFRTALSLDSTDFWLHNYLGQAAQKTGDFALALEESWTAVKLSGGADSQQINFAYTLYETALEKGVDFVDSYVHNWRRSYPHNPLVAYVVDSLCGNTHLTRADSHYVRQIFDVFADSFDAALHDLNYVVPQLIAQKTAAVLPPDSHPQMAVLDAGCGTGLCGLRLSQLYPQSRIFGVDLSAGMLTVAAQKNIYHQLIEDDLEHYLRRQESVFDLIVCADVLTYFGALPELFALFSQNLKPNGYFIFSVTANTVDSAPYHLHLSGRFAHQENYVRDSLSAGGFSVANQCFAKLRSEGENDVNGWIFTAVKNR